MQASSFKVTGTIIDIMETQSFGANGFQKRTFAIEYKDKPDTQYPQTIAFDLLKDKCDIIDAYAVGQEVEVSFNLTGRTWDGPKGRQYFTTLVAWKVQPAAGSVAKPTAKESEARFEAEGKAKKPAQAGKAPAYADDDDNDLPF